MAHDRAAADGSTLERYRDYLRLMAAGQVAPRFRGKADLSGIVQETLWEAHREVEGGLNVPSGQRLPWLRRILANNLADEVRRLTAEKRDVGRELSLHQAVETSSQQLELWLAKDLQPSRQAEREEQVLKLAAAIAALPEAQQEALILHYWNGWTLVKISEHLGRSRDAIAGLIRRGVK